MKSFQKKWVSAMRTFGVGFGLLWMSVGDERKLRADESGLGSAVSTQVGGNESSDATSELHFQQDESGVRVFLGGQLVTQFLLESGTKPVLWPLYSPSGIPLTRNYPISESVERETKDHIHHRSVWFTHGEVNDVDFWAETAKRQGRVVLKEVEAISTEHGTVVIEAANDWVDSAGERLLEEAQRFEFAVRDGRLVIDCSFSLAALQPEIHFGDTKEGTFGIRVSEDLRVDSKRGGRIVNSHGQRDGAAWGKSANWCDYSQIKDDQILGVTVFVHPESWNAPGGWHVRTYGLFAHNPFAKKAFAEAEGLSEDQVEEGGLRLGKGDSIQLRYRLWLHDSAGEESTGWSEQSAEAVWQDFIVGSKR